MRSNVFARNHHGGSTTVWASGELLDVTSGLLPAAASPSSSSILVNSRYSVVRGARVAALRKCISCFCTKSPRGLGRGLGLRGAPVASSRRILRLASVSQQ